MLCDMGVQWIIVPGMKRVGRPATCSTVAGCDQLHAPLHMHAHGSCAVCVIIRLPIHPCPAAGAAHVDRPLQLHAGPVSKLLCAIRAAADGQPDAGGSTSFTVQKGLAIQPLCRNPSSAPASHLQAACPTVPPCSKQGGGVRCAREAGGHARPILCLSGPQAAGCTFQPRRGSSGSSGGQGQDQGQGPQGAA